MIQVDNLMEKYGKVTAVDHFSFEFRLGQVTGFLDSNESGKSTTMRCIMGLDRPTSGKCTINGQEYGRLSSSLTTVGALLNGHAFHPNRMVRQQLMVAADTHGFPKAWVDEVLEITGIINVTNKHLKRFSLGIGQHFGIVTALLGDPQILIFDESINSLDLGDVRWVRKFIRTLAGQGRTILVSSYLMSEISQMADDLVVTGKGKFIAQGDVKQFTESATHRTINVPGSDIHAVMDALSKARIYFDVNDGDEHNPVGVMRVNGGERVQIGYALYIAHMEIRELSEIHSSLENASMELTTRQVEYDSGSSISGVPGQTPAQAPQGGQR